MTERPSNDSSGAERSVAPVYLVELRLFTLLLILIALVVWDGRRRFPEAIEIDKPTDLRHGAMAEVRSARPAPSVVAPGEVGR